MLKFYKQFRNQQIPFHECTVFRGLSGAHGVLWRGTGIVAEGTAEECQAFVRHGLHCEYCGVHLETNDSVCFQCGMERKFE